jgi:hypothetical protein
MSVQYTKKEVKLTAFYLARSNKTPYAVHKTSGGFWKASKLNSISPEEMVYLVYDPNGKHRIFKSGRAAKYLTLENPRRKHTHMGYDGVARKKINPTTTIGGSGDGWQAAHAYRQLPDGRVQILTNPNGKVSPKIKIVKRNRGK